MPSPSARCRPLRRRGRGETGPLRGASARERCIGTRAGLCRSLRDRLQRRLDVADAVEAGTLIRLVSRQPEGRLGNRRRTVFAAPAGDGRRPTAAAAVVDLALVHEPVHGHFARRKCLGWRARSRSSAPSRGWGITPRRSARCRVHCCQFFFNSELIGSASVLASRGRRNRMHSFEARVAARPSPVDAAVKQRASRRVDFHGE